jgi:hypothetical protein
VIVMPKTELYAPPSYVAASEAVRRAHTNGCGAGVLALLVPNTIWGLDITVACNIHDWMYGEGETMADKEEADDVFRNNLIRLIDTRTPWGWLKKLRLRRARTYYLAVHHFGGPAFWRTKNPSATLYLVRA